MASALVWLKRGLRLRDHGPQGDPVRRWVPRLGAAACPPPIVDERAALAWAKGGLHALRATPEARTEADAVQHHHGSRKRGLPPSGLAGGQRRHHAAAAHPRQQELL